MTLGVFLKNRRKELKMSMNELAEKIGYAGRTSIFEIENGNKGDNLIYAAKLLKYLNITPDELINKKLSQKNKKVLITTYGGVYVVENEDNSITVTYNTEKNVLVDMCSGNQIRFITVEPYTNKILTK